MAYDRTIRFQDTDAAGVVYFANVLSICHEAYEESLIQAGIEVRSFFNRGEIVVPIVHASVDFFKPMMCGDRISIHLIPKQLNESEFEIQYEITNEKILGKALTKHICIHAQTRTRTAFPSALKAWLESMA